VLVVKRKTQEELEKMIEKFEKEPQNRIMSEEALRASEENYREIFNASQDALIIHDPKTGSIVDANQRACKMLKYSREELIKGSLGFLSSGESPYSQEEALRWILKASSEGPQTFEWSAKNSENKLFWIEVNLKGCVIRGNEIILAASRDITERKRAEEQLRESEKKFRSIFEHMAAACCFDEIVYEDGKAVDYRIIDVNSYYEKIIGISKSAAVGALASKLYGTGEAPFLDVYSRVAETGRPASFEAYFAPIGKHLQIHSSCPKKGQFFTVFTDITERKKVEESLRNSEERFHQLFETMSNCVVIYAPTADGDNFLFKDLNHAAARVENVTRETVVGRSVLEVFPGVKEFGLFEVFQRVWKTGKPESHPVGFYKDNRISGWRENFVYKLSSGEVVAIYEDATKRKQAEENLQENEKKYRFLYQEFEGLLNAIPDNIALVSPDLKFLWINKDAAVVINKTLPNISGQCCYQVRHNRSEPCEGCPVTRSLQSKKPETEEITTDDGISIDIRAIPIIDEQGEVKEIIEVARNITERKRAEEVLKDREEELASIYDNAPLVMLLVDENWKIRKTNAFTNQFVGTTAENIINMRCGEALRCVHALDNPEGCGFGPSCKECVLRLTILNTIETGLSHREKEVSMSFSDGENEREVTFLISTTKLFIREQPLALVSIQDITKRKQLEEDLKKSQEQLYQAQKMKSLGTLVAGVAHEINNPINSINLNTLLLQKIWHDFRPILKDYAVNEPLKKYGGLTYNFIKENLGQLLNDINLEANRIIKIVADLKNFARQTNIADKKPININEAVENALRLIQTTVKKSGVDLAVSLENNPPLFEGNLPCIEQVILNLTLNALQAINHSRGKIEIATGFDKQKEELFITVSDNGQGIDPAIADRIFDPFVTNRQAEGGTGIGLSITYNLVNAHNGKITFETEKGKGTTFKISLPLHPKKKLPKILIVDDDKPIRDLLKSLFDSDTKRHFQVQEAANGTEACVKLGTFRPDLLILDLLMPEMDGLEVCRVILKQPELANMKVLLLTGFPDHPKTKQVAAIGFTNIYAKPFNPGEFMRVIDHLLKENDNAMMPRNSAS
jgi:PAS domain S-box-containing protein